MGLDPPRTRPQGSGGEEEVGHQGEVVGGGGEGGQPLGLRGVGEPEAAGQPEGGVAGGEDVIHEGPVVLGARGRLGLYIMGRAGR